MFLLMEHPPDQFGNRVYTRGVLISPHRGGSTTAFPRRAARYVEKQIEHYVRNGRITHVVARGEER